jgi:ribonuclease HI
MSFDSNCVQELTDEFEEFEIRYIPREENRKADSLVEQAFSD